MKKGILLSLLTAAISGVSIFSNSMFVSHADPLVFSLVRNAFVAVLLSIVVVFLGHAKNLKRLSRKEWGLLGAIGAIGGGIPFAMFFVGLAKIGALNGNIIQKSLFIWVAILAIPLLHERLSKMQLVGYLILFVGMFVFGGTYKLVPSTGAFLVLGATILWAIENVIAKVTLKSVTPLIVAWGRMLFGLPFLLAATVMMGKTHLVSAAAVAAPAPLIVSSLLLVAYVATLYTALSKAPATVVSSVLVFAPVVTAVLITLTHHTSIFSQGVNLILLTIGTALVIFERLTPKNTKQPV